jgi:carbonic anhydrase
MSNITALLERNKEFAGGGAWRNTARLPFLPFKGLYIITCIDPRTDPADFLGNWSSATRSWHARSAAG